MEENINSLLGQQIQRRFPEMAKITEVWPEVLLALSVQDCRHILEHVFLIYTSDMQLKTGQYLAVAGTQLGSDIYAARKLGTAHEKASKALGDAVTEILKETLQVDATLAPLGENLQGAKILLVRGIVCLGEKWKNALTCIQTASQTFD